MSKLWMFILAVLDHWAVLVTGGVVTAGLAVLQAWLQKPISWRFYIWVLVVFIAAECFLAWRDEYDRAQRLVEEKATLQGQIRELRSDRSLEEYPRAIEKLQTMNTQMEAELRSSQQALSALQHSLKARRLSADERRGLMDVLALHSGTSVCDIM